jgi:Mor family transcriptional regulator
MSDTLSPEEIRRELAGRLPDLSAEQLERLASAFVELAAGKYVTGRRWAVAKRNRIIQAMYDGSNIRELARQFGLSPRHVRRLTRLK